MARIGKDLTIQWRTTISQFADGEWDNLVLRMLRDRSNSKTRGVRVSEHSSTICNDEAKRREDELERISQTSQTNLTCSWIWFWRAANFFAVNFWIQNKKSMKIQTSWPRVESGRSHGVSSLTTDQKFVQLWNFGPTKNNRFVGWMTTCSASIRPFVPWVIVCFLSQRNNGWKNYLNQRSKNSLWLLKNEDSQKTVDVCPRPVCISHGSKKHPWNDSKLVLCWTFSSQRIKVSCALTLKYRHHCIMLYGYALDVDLHSGHATRRNSHQKLKERIRFF